MQFVVCQWALFSSISYIVAKKIIPEMRAFNIKVQLITIFQIRLNFFHLYSSKDYQVI
ncbi:expressed protein [Dictyostelium purpureum]|uniref:Expressed protein n=1 Tax=Dictyostelium purpureum TaxID=5786 RepID=F0ZHP7_DICPU|nr:uncharacterized protein DICPUDRAFT_87378 [Dictyostelium purpureum]EGC36569.1 expressed protein [Dictyostelium purpureum]|eukprot:XP_003286941.1 expressed protein [Dictyostelium purpureum]